MTSTSSPLCGNRVTSLIPQSSPSPPLPPPFPLGHIGVLSRELRVGRSVLIMCFFIVTGSALCPTVSYVPGFQCCSLSVFTMSVSLPVCMFNYPYIPVRLCSMSVSSCVHVYVSILSCPLRFGYVTSCVHAYLYLIVSVPCAHVQLCLYPIVSVTAMCTCAAMSVSHCVCNYHVHMSSYVCIPLCL